MSGQRRSGRPTSVRQFSKASGITAHVTEYERILSPCQPDAPSCDLFAIPSAIHRAFGADSPAMVPARYRLKLFMCAVFGPDIFNEQQRAVLWQVLRPQCWTLPTISGSSSVAYSSIEDFFVSRAKGNPVTPSSDAASTPSKSSVDTQSPRLDITQSKSWSPNSSTMRLATPSRHFSATPSEKNPDLSPGSQTATAPKFLVTPAKTLSSISSRESPSTPTPPMNKCSRGKTQTLHALFAILQDPTPPKSLPDSSTKRRQRSEGEEMQVTAKRRRIEEEKQDALTRQRTPSKSEREGKIRYEQWLMDLEILALDAAKYQCHCLKWIEHVQKGNRKEGFVYLQYQMSRKRHHDKKCAARLVSSSIRWRGAARTY